MMESQFEIIKDEVIWSYIRSNAISQNRAQSELRKNGILSIPISCKSCSAKWVSFGGNQKGMFSELIGQVCISCPNCDNEEKIPYSDIELK